MSAGFSKDRVERLRDLMDDHTKRGGVPGLTWLIARGEEVHADASGIADATAPSPNPVARDYIFRIASMTKPVTAIAALIVLEQCAVRLDDPVDDLLPELADRQVISGDRTSIDVTEPAHRAITVRDVLTFRLGHGFDFTERDDQPVLDALSELGVGIGAAPSGTHPGPDEYLRILGSVPLARQPGERWLYDTGSDVLGVLIARAMGQPFDDFLRQRIFEPLGMRDTAFFVPAEKRNRFGAAHGAVDEATGVHAIHDAADGDSTSPPPFPSGAGGLVSTVDDFLVFAAMLRAGGTTPDGERLVSRAAIDLMTTDHLTDEQRATSGPDPSGAVGWGFGVGIQLSRTSLTRGPGAYGWDGGLGSSWANDPREDLIGILLTNQAFTSATPPKVIDDFWTCAYAALAS